MQKEEWMKILLSIQKKESFLEQALRREENERIVEPPPAVYIENDSCVLCTKPHFQGGLCLYHFHQRYT